MAKQIQWNCQTNPLKSLNKSIEIVERNQWIRFLETAVSFAETGRMTTQRQQKTWGKVLRGLRRYTNMHE